ncbi:unnamed protein product [Amaranthus hypochondriacus]
MFKTNECLDNNGECWPDKAAYVTACEEIATSSNTSLGDTEDKNNPLES